MIRPDIDVATANPAGLKALLRFISQSCITGGEDRSWGPAIFEEAKDIGRRLFAIGGIDLCRSVCDELGKEWRSHNIRRSDAKLLEILWCDPVVPGWYP